MSDESTITTHPSYALISASRVHSGGAAPMFGSRIRHRNYIILSIEEAEDHRSLNRNWRHGRKQIIQLRMSETQFASFITSLNVGGGTPCTIERRDGRQVEPPPFHDERSIVKDEFKKKTKEVAATLDEAEARLQELLKPGSKINKAELQLLLKDIEKAKREVRSNLPFVEEQFEEAMEETVGEAKATIEAFMMDTASRMGLSQSKAVGTADDGPILEIEG